MWSNTYTAGNYRPRNIPFKINEGIKVPLPQNPEEIDFFNLYFTDAVIDIIWIETNILYIYINLFMNTNGFYKFFMQYNQGSVNNNISAFYTILFLHSLYFLSYAYHWHGMKQGLSIMDYGHHAMTFWYKCIFYMPVAVIIIILVIIMANITLDVNK